MSDASDHRELPPLIGASDDEGESVLVETAEDLEQLEEADENEAAPGGVAPV